jgi:hypothetical protein
MAFSLDYNTNLGGVVLGVGDPNYVTPLNWLALCSRADKHPFSLKLEAEQQTTPTNARTVT